MSCSAPPRAGLLPPWVGAQGRGASPLPPLLPPRSDAPSLSCIGGEDSAPPAFLEAAGLVKSRGEAKRLIKEGALSVDGRRCDDALTPLPAGDYVIRLGKKRFLKLNVR